MTGFATVRLGAELPMSIDSAVALLRPPLEGDQARVVLGWGYCPRDLRRLVPTTAAGFSRCGGWPACPTIRAVGPARPGGWYSP